MNSVFTVDATAFKGAVNFVRHALGASKTDLSVQLFLFEVRGSSLSIFAASKELFANVKVPVQADTDASMDFAVMGSKIERLISLTEADNYTVEVESDNAKFTAGLLHLSLEVYDTAAVKTVKQTLTPNFTPTGVATQRAVLDEALSVGKTCTTTSSVRPDVCHVEIRGGKSVASDGRKISIYSTESFPPALALKVPSTALTDFLSAVKNISAEHVTVAESGSYYVVHGSLGAFSLGVRKVERSFPPIETQLADNWNPSDEVAIDGATLELMLKGVALGLAAEDVKVDIKVTGAPNSPDATLEVGSVNGVGKRSWERAPCGRKAEAEIAFPVSYKHLVDTLSVFKGDSVVDMLVLTDRSAVVVRDTTPAREVLTLIPFRTAAAVDAEAKEAKAAAVKATSTEAREAEQAAQLAGATVAEDIDM